MPQLKATRGIRLNKSHPISRGLVGYWLFNEGSGGQVFDLSGKGNIGTFNADAHFVSGKFGSAVNLDGTDDHIAFTTKGFSSTNGSFIIWLRPGFAYDTAINYQMFFSLYTETADRWNFDYWATDDKWHVYQNQGGSITNVTSSAQSFAANSVWIQLAITWNASLITLYVNGVQDSTPGTNRSGITMPSTMYIGEYGGGNYEIIADIDHAAMFNRALSAFEIALLYREPFCMFERAWIPKLIGGQIVELAGSSVSLSSFSATAKAMRKVGGNVVGTSDVAALLNLIHSLLYIERNWLREALFNGMTANAFKLGTTLSLGWFWVRAAGCSVLYRGSSMGEIDFVNILAVAEQNAREISPPSYISHNSGSTYFYVVRRFNNCGYQERTLAASVKVSIESNGELAEPQPNKVFDSGAELVDGNKILLVWYYCPLEQKSQPICFNVYYDGRTGQINYENPLAIISYKGRKFYSYQCSALEAGRYLFAIRTEDASGIENSSLARLRIQFDPTNPEAIDILSAEGV